MSKKSRNRKRNFIPLQDQYRLYFNRYRGADIEGIWDSEGQIVVRYHDGREVPLTDLLSWTQLFDKLNELHPKKLPASPPQ